MKKEDKKKIKKLMEARCSRQNQVNMNNLG